MERPPDPVNPRVWLREHARHHEIDVGSARLHVVEAGAGRPVILLHGFPEFWFAWRHQIPALAAAGRHVLAPDMRGFNLSSKPAGVSSYGLDALIGDVNALAAHFGVSDATLVGHDWGALVAWHVAMTRPAWLRRLAIINTPHPVMALRGWRTPRQIARSWYIWYFQLPRIPERRMRLRRAEALVNILTRDPRRPGAYTPEDIEDYVQAHLAPGALTATVNYYRAAFRGGAAKFAGPKAPIEVPTLVLWGDADLYLESWLATPPAAQVPNCTVRYFPGASHWLMADRPDDVSEALIAHSA